jgi:hypothetical protein
MFQRLPLSPSLGCDVCHVHMLYLYTARVFPRLDSVGNGGHSQMISDVLLLHGPHGEQPLGHLHSCCLS